MVSDTRQAESPVWLRLLGAGVLLVLGGSLAYATAIALLNFSRIGV